MEEKLDIKLFSFANSSRIRALMFFSELEQIFSQKVRKVVSLKSCQVNQNAIIVIKFYFISKNLLFHDKPFQVVLKLRAMMDFQSFYFYNPFTFLMFVIFNLSFLALSNNSKLFHKNLCILYRRTRNCDAISENIKHYRKIVDCDIDFVTQNKFSSSLGIFSIYVRVELLGTLAML